MPFSPDPTPAEARHLAAARRLLELRQMRESLAVARRQPSLRNSILVGVQAALTVLIALSATYMSPWPQLVGYASLGSLVALFGRFSSRRGRGGVLVLSALTQTGGVVLMSAVTALGAPKEVQLAVLALFCGVAVFIAATGRVGAPGPLIFAFAAGASMVSVAGWTEVAERGLATGAVSIVALLVCLATEPLRQQPTPERAFPVEPLRPASHRAVAAARIAFGAAVAAFATHAVGAAHPAWAALGAVAVLQGAHLHISMNRALQRMAGTLVGGVMVWFVLSAQPGIWQVIWMLAFLQIATELVIGYNYAFGQAFVTPMALLTSYLAAPGAAGAEMAPERVLDTLIGASIGMVAALILSTIDDRAFLARHADGK